MASMACWRRANRASKRAARASTRSSDWSAACSAGSGGMSGSVPAIWTQLRGWKRDLRRATMQVYNIAMHVFTLTIYWRTGTLDATVVRLFVAVAPAMLIPAYFGARLYGGFSEKAFHAYDPGVAVALRRGLALRLGVRAIWRTK